LAIALRLIAGFTLVPQILSKAGTARSYIETLAETGLSGKPKNTLLLSLPKAKGFPGLIATCQKLI